MERPQRGCFHFLLCFAYDADVIVPRYSAWIGYSASRLHREVNARAYEFARAHALLHDVLPGHSASVVFGEDAERRHGNFHPASYRAILENAEWRVRLGKAHTASRRTRPRADWSWRELDCAASSDALLMNIFCYPGVFCSVQLRGLLGVDGGVRPQFGVHPRLPLRKSLVDTTELDMELGELLVESKLTEKDFQAARPALLARYVGVDEVFEADALPRTAAGGYTGYQLIRGVLAAEQMGHSFCVLCDERRADLMEVWAHVQAAVRTADLRSRCKLLTWQELAGALPRPLQVFLADKSGILPRTCRRGLAWSA